MRQGKMLRTVGSIAADPENEFVLIGTAVLFNNTITIAERDGWKITEEIAPTACDNALARPDDVRCLLNHNPDLIFGRNLADNLVLWKDEKGLNFRDTLEPEIDWHANYWKAVQRKDLTQCSFAFSIDGEEKIRRDYGTHYIITDMHLYDVSVVTYPAYADTTAYARDLDGAGRLRIEEKDFSVLQAEIDLL